jgi:pyruvate/2-oxoglutarate dehydrogenase complex dihydrolipoamide dehydrogenase (E3) component
MNDPTVLALVHPEDWVNPRPAPLYDLVVLGGGTAGLVSAVGAAGLGARVALVERASLGGDCLMTGCVPSKALLRSARAAGEIRRAGDRGLSATLGVDFRAVVDRLRQRRAALAPHDSAARLRGLGIDVFFGHAAFADGRTVAVDGQLLTFRRAVIATGARPAVPGIPGLQDVPYLTTESIFDLETLPSRLVVLGGGPVGCELAQAFALLGCSVTLIEAAPALLPSEDPDASAVLARRLSEAGITVRLSARVAQVSRLGDEIGLSLGPASADVSCDQLLVATGRRANVEDIGIDRAGVRAGRQGVEVDDHLRTANRRIYAAGDVCSSLRFTHAADAAARIVIRNALFFGRERVSRLIVPRCVYTAPEVGHVGADASTLPPGTRTITVRFGDVDRAVLDDDTDGFVRVHHRGGRLVGATVVGPHAGEMVGLIGLAMRRGVTLGQCSSTVFPYPTLADALRKAGDSYRRESLTPSTRAWLARYFSFVRRF